MLRILFIILLSLFFANILNAQKIITRGLIINGDTIPHVLLDEVKVKGKRHSDGFYKRYDRRKARLEYNVRKAYPYAKIAAKTIGEINHKIALTQSKSERKKIIKQEYNDLMKSFKKPLMKLSVSQGRILVRLVYRETNNSSFTHIQEYRGSVNAYFWQSVALLFGNNLKADYEPLGTDAEIEEIVRRIESGELSPL